MKAYLLYSVLIFAAVSCFPTASPATRQYAQETGFPCRKCHIDAAGGGPLTGTGERFLSDLKKKGLYRPLGPV